MKKFKILPLTLALLVCASLFSVPAMAAEPEIGASAAIVADTGSGEVYYAKNADQAVPPASTTKMVTALLVAEAVDRGEIALSDTVTAYGDCQYNLDELSSDANPAIEPGETMTVEDLLYCAMLISANEACNILAEYVSGSISGFVDDMNARAQELGCVNTHFTNTNGLEEDGHYTTAADFALIAREALKSPLFLQVCGAQSHTVAATNMQDARELKNTNSLLDPESDYYYEYAYGVKTGFFTNAGYCLVSAAAKDDIDVICVLLGGRESGDQFGDTLTLYNWMFDNYQYRPILSSTEALDAVAVSLGTTDTVSVRAQNAISAVLPNDYDASHVEYQWVYYHEQEGRQLEAPVNAGDVLGEVTAVETDGNGNVIKTFGTSLLVASATVDMSRVEYLRTQVGELFRTPVVRRIITVLIILLAAYLLLVVFYYIQRVRHLRSLREAKRERAERQAEDEAQWLDIPGRERGRRISGYDGGEYYDDDGQLPPAEDEEYYEDYYKE